MQKPKTPSTTYWYLFLSGLGLIILVLTAWLNANQNYDTTRQKPIPDVRIRSF